MRGRFGADGRKKGRRRGWWSKETFGKNKGDFEKVKREKRKNSYNFEAKSRELRGRDSSVNLMETLTVFNRSSVGFSPDFVFGTAGSSYQYEGAAKEDGKGPSIWDTFTLRYPGKIRDGSNGSVAVESYHRYKEDVQIMKKIGLKAYRFSISWARVLPSGKLSAGVDKEGVKYYSDLIDELLANGIEPYVTLFHFDLPQALEDEYGGFLSTQILADFRDYAELCFWEFGDRVKHWITLNEPWTFSSQGYASGVAAPGRGSSSSEQIKKSLHRHRSHPWNLQTCDQGDPATEPYIVAHNLLLAHAVAVESYRTKFQASQEGKIGITLVSDWSEPLDDKSDSDVRAARRAIDFMFGWFMEPVATGEYPETMRKIVGSRLPKFSPEQAAMVKGSYDFLGLNYYTGGYVTSAPPPSPNDLSYETDQQVTSTRERNGVAIGAVSGLEWLYSYPVGFYKLLMYVKNTYNVPLIYITENGWADANRTDSTLAEGRADKLRIDYYRDHLTYLVKAIEDGVNVKGYFAWSLLDNFEWGEGYTARFGIVYVDYKNDLERYPKDSAIWFKNFLKQKNITQTPAPPKRQLGTKNDHNESAKKARK